MELNVDNNVYYTNNVSWTVLCNEVFIFDEITDKIYMLKDVSKDFWLLIETTHNLYNIILRLTETYNLDYYSMESEILKKANKFYNNNLIMRCAI